MHIRLKFRNHHKLKQGDTLKGHVLGDGSPRPARGNANERSMFGRRREKPCVCEVVPVPQTDTGSQEENSKANGRKVVKELGKLTP